MNNICIIIPALNPDTKLLELVDQLNEKKVGKIIVVDDGSAREYKTIFTKLSNKDNCVLLTHEENRGKGRALKTAFKYYIDNLKNFVGVVTVDADGQHLVRDVVKVANHLRDQNTKTVFIGSRTFDKTNPLRSRFGNHLTKYLFYFFSGVKIRDTQTGLRAIPHSLLSKFIKVSGERYEYELNMLLATQERGIKIREIDITTVYIEDNNSSHFNIFLDSFRIYFIFFKFLLSSLSAFFLDIVFFGVIFYFTEYLFLSLATAKILSSLYNFAVNKKLVFASRNNNLRDIIYYYTLFFSLLALSYLFIKLFSQAFDFNVVLSKIIIEMALFFISFYIQSRYIFNKS